jgi:amino acid permease
MTPPPDLPEQNYHSAHTDKYISRSWFMSIIGGICLFLMFIGYNIYSRIDKIESNSKSDIKDLGEKYQSDHDKIMKFEDLKPIIQTDHDNLIKSEARLENLEARCLKK